MKSKTGAALLLVVTFLLGGVTGGVSHYLFKNHAAADVKPANHRVAAGEVAQDMARTLQLDEKQKESLITILRQGRERYRALSLQFRPQYEALRTETHEEIRQILREDQKPRFDEVLKDMDKRHKERLAQAK